MSKSPMLSDTVCSPWKHSEKAVMFDMKKNSILSIKEDIEQMSQEHIKASKLTKYSIE